jgi:hypothetical protein
MEDRRLTVREIANDIGISYGSAHAILTDDLDMRRVAAKFVPKFLSCEQKELRLIQDFLSKHGIPQVRQAPYSPDMAHCDFWLFPKLKMSLKGLRFESREDIMKNAAAQLVAIPKEDFQQWEDPWVKCVESQGNYFFPLAYGRILLHRPRIASDARMIYEL